MARSFSAGNQYDRHTNNDSDDAANHFIFHRYSPLPLLTHTKMPYRYCVVSYRSICARLASDVNGGSPQLIGEWLSWLLLTTRDAPIAIAPELLA